MTKINWMYNLPSWSLRVCKRWHENKTKKNKESQQTKDDVNYIQMNNLSFNYFKFSWHYPCFRNWTTAKGKNKKQYRLDIFQLWLTNSYMQSFERKPLTKIKKKIATTSNSALCRLLILPINIHLGTYSEIAIM